jgi:hypothetical protein
MDNDALLGQELGTALVLFHQAIADRLELSVTEWKCLDALDHSGALTAGKLAELTGLTTGAITGIVDRLVRRGKVERQPDPSDRRRVIIQSRPDPARAQALGEIFGALGEAMQALPGRYNAQEQAAIRDYLSTTIAILREQTRKLRR